MVVSLAFDVIANDRGIRIEGPASVDHRGQWLIFDVDQLQRVTRRVPVVGDDEGHLLPMEAHLVGGEHGHHVVGQRRYPGKLQRLEQRPSDHCPNLRMCLGRCGVDRDQPCVRVRAAQHRAVQHARQHEVVDVIALAAQEASVLLAHPPPEANVRLLCSDGHDAATSSVSAARG